MVCRLSTLTSKESLYLLSFLFKCKYLWYVEWSHNCKMCRKVVKKESQAIFFIMNALRTFYFSLYPKSVSFSVSNFLWFYSLTRECFLILTLSFLLHCSPEFLASSSWKRPSTYSKKIRGKENWYLPPPGMQESWGLPQCDVFFPSYLKRNDKNRGVHSRDHCD